MNRAAILGKSINIMEKNTEAPSEASKKADLEENAEKCICLSPGYMTKSLCNGS
jgi:hypothetical protein